MEFQPELLIIHSSPLQRRSLSTDTTTTNQTVSSRAPPESSDDGATHAACTNALITYAASFADLGNHAFGVLGWGKRHGLCRRSQPQGNNENHWSDHSFLRRSKVSCACMLTVWKIEAIGSFPGLHRGEYGASSDFTVLLTSKADYLWGANERQRQAHGQTDANERKTRDCRCQPLNFAKFTRHCVRPFGWTHAQSPLMKGVTHSPQSLALIRGAFHGPDARWVPDPWFPNSSGSRFLLCLLDVRCARAGLRVLERVRKVAHLPRELQLPPSHYRADRPWPKSKGRAKVHAA